MTYIHNNYLLYKSLVVSFILPELSVVDKKQLYEHIMTIIHISEDREFKQHIDYEVSNKNYENVVDILNDLLLIHYNNIEFTEDVEDIDNRISYILDVMIDNLHTDLLFKYGLFTKPLFLFIKKNIDYSFNKILHIVNRCSYNKSDTLYYILLNMKDYNATMFIEVMRVFDLPSIFEQLYKKHIEHKHMKNKHITDTNQLNLKLPLRLDYTLDDIDAIYYINKSFISNLQLSLITGLNIDNIINDNKEFFSEATPAKLNMLDKHIDLDYSKYRLTEKELYDMYMIEKEPYRTSLYKTDDIKFVGIKYHNIEDIDIKYVDTRYIRYHIDKEYKLLCDKVNVDKSIEDMTNFLNNRIYNYR